MKTATKITALIIGMLLIITGITFAMNAFIPVADMLGVPVRDGQVHAIGLFGLLIFGIGFSLLLTQFFRERYSAKIAGITAGGTLAAIYIIVIIIKSAMSS